MEHGNPVGGKGPKHRQQSQKQPSLLEVPQEHQAIQPKAYAEDLAQNHTGSMSAISFSVSSYETCLVYSVGSVLLVSLTSLASTVLSHPLLWAQSCFPGPCTCDLSSSIVHSAIKDSVVCDMDRLPGV